MYQLNDLLYLMSRLRHPDHGCPWDKKQDFASIVPHTIEEAYEVADAIERGNKADLKDELGDLLFQVVFYSQLAQEEATFSFDDVVDGIVRKLLRRHPHVFPEGDLKRNFPPGQQPPEEFVKSQWETIKAAERAEKGEAAGTTGFTSLLADIPGTLPVLSRAAKLQKRASQHGFDWESIGPVFHKVAEELEEIRVALCRKDGAKDDGDLAANDSAQARQNELEDEMGDLLFACVNLARFLKVSPDNALRRANAKFIRRFQFIEQRLVAQGKTVDGSSLVVLDRLWDEAKAAEKAAGEK